MFDEKATGEAVSVNQESLVKLLVQFVSMSSFSQAARSQASDWQSALESDRRINRGPPLYLLACFLFSRITCVCSSNGPLV